MKKITIVIDFDDTIVTNNYPSIGELKVGAKRVINKLYDEGHTIIINTCRVNEYEDEARKALNDNGIKYHYLNENSEELIEKYNMDCRKISGDIYIDNKNLGTKIISWDDIEQKIDYYINHKPIIFAIVGESGSGKTTLVDYIERQHNIPMIQSYTDRPKRYEDEIGHTFVTKEEYNNLSKEDMIAETQFGEYRYCCLKQDVQPYNTYVIDEREMINLTKNKDYEVVSIMVKRDIEKRKLAVTEERLKRDEGKFGQYHDYSYCIMNNCRLEDMIKKMDDILVFMLNDR